MVSDGIGLPSVPSLLRPREAGEGDRLAIGEVVEGALGDERSVPRPFHHPGRARMVPLPRCAGQEHIWSEPGT